jgi:hypothetical protein
VGLLRARDLEANIEGSAASGAGSEAEIEYQVSLEVVGNKTGVGHARQVVSTMIQRRRVVRFTLEISARGGDKHLCAKSLREFPRIFPARNASQSKSSLQNACRWFKMGLDD